MTTTATRRPATDKQISYLLALLEQREVEPSYAFELKIGLEDLDIREASKAIDNLKSYPRRVGDLTARYRTYEDALVAAQKWIDAR